MELEEILKNRKSCRNFNGEPVDSAHIQQILWAADRAPYASGGPRRVVRWTDSYKDAMKQACFDQEYVGECGVVFIFTGKEIQWPQEGSNPHRFPKGTVMASGHAKYVFDVAAAVMCADLMARSLGYQTCWIGNFSSEMVSRINKLRYRPVMLLLVGKPDEG